MVYLFINSRRNSDPTKLGVNLQIVHTSRCKPADSTHVYLLILSLGQRHQGRDRRLQIEASGGDLPWAARLSLKAG
jgi:hypothetical protein